jgi:hypothetical protein
MRIERYFSVFVRCLDWVLYRPCKTKIYQYKIMWHGWGYTMLPVGRRGGGGPTTGRAGDREGARCGCGEVGVGDRETRVVFK